MRARRQCKVSVTLPNNMKMALIEFAASLQRHAKCPPVQCEARCLMEALVAAWHIAPGLRGYVIDEQGHIRRHVAVFINGELLRDRSNHELPIAAGDRIYVAQALSGG